MEKVLKYQKLITELLDEYAADWRSPQLELQTVYDFQRHHYQLVALGWVGKDYFHNTLLHFDIKDGKIWVQQNMTEEYVAEELNRRSVPKSDIVLGLQPPAYRKYSDYAVA